MKLGAPSIYWIWRQNRREGKTVYMAFYRNEPVSGALDEGKLAQARHIAESDPDYRVRPVRLVPLEEGMIGGPLPAGGKT